MGRITDPAASVPPPSAPLSAAPPKLITLKQEWLVIGVCAALIVGMEVAGALIRDDSRTPFAGASAVVSWFAHAGWLSMDRRRRHLDVGWWRFGALFFGPLAIALYLILEYRARALYLIPLMLAVYLVVAFAIIGILGLVVASKLVT